jgi:hypothetical protein
MDDAFGLIVIVRFITIIGRRHMIVLYDDVGDEICYFYHDPTTKLEFRTPTGYSNNTSWEFATAPWYAIGVTKASGTVLPRFHARNLYGGAEPLHEAATGGISQPNDAALWSQTVMAATDIDMQDSSIRLASAAVFDFEYSDAQFDSVLDATSQIAAIGPVRLWDFNQTTTGIDVVNLLTTVNDQTDIIGTTVITGNNPPGWVFGLVATPPPPDGGYRYGRVRSPRFG